MVLAESAAVSAAEASVLREMLHKNARDPGKSKNHMALREYASVPRKKLFGISRLAEPGAPIDSTVTSYLL
jgi:hypothetical protein